MAVIEPGHTTIPLETSNDVKLMALVPPHWYEGARQGGLREEPEPLLDRAPDRLLRVVGTVSGDAEALEEVDLAIDAPVTLLQVGHQGSKTSSRLARLDRAKPKYAVIPRRGMGRGRTARTVTHAKRR